VLLETGVAYLKHVEEIENTITERWYDIARRVGVTEKDCEKISSAFAYPGFRLKIAAQ
jgi:serine/threonine-protein kinase HipA